LEYRVKLFPKAAPIGRLEIERINILILLGRIFSVLDGTVRTNVEPRGMLSHPRMVRRTLERDVQGDLHSVGLDCGNKMVKIGVGAEFRVDGLVAAVIFLDEIGVGWIGSDSSIPDGPGAAGIARLGSSRVFRTLAKGAADGVNGRHIKDVETHRRNLGEL